MASSPPPPLPSPTSKQQQYYYFVIVGMAVVALFLLLTNSLAVRCCMWLRRVVTGREAEDPPTPPPGLSVQQWIPAHKYRRKEEEEEEGADGECPVCLTAFADGDEVRELPQCGHAFHVACIDMWFHSHASCPVCRSVVLPTPSESVEMPAQASHSRENLLGYRMEGGIIAFV